MEKTTRREFLRRAAVGGAAMAGLQAMVPPGSAEAAGDDRTRIVIARNTAMMTPDGVDPKAVKSTLDRAMTALTGKKDSAAAWKSLFRPDDVVGIKLNCLFGKSVSTRTEVTDAVIAGLRSAGVKAENIIVWDRKTGDLAKCGYTVNKSGPGVIYYADDDDWGEDVRNGSFHGRVTKVFERITALINLPVVKHHSIAGISGALKNHYGSFHNPSDHHGNDCDPYLADLNAIPQIKNKTRLVVADAIRPQADGGPGRNLAAQWDYHSLIVGTDPVAVDRQCFEIIDARRREVGIDSVGHKANKWLSSAQARGVGTNDPSRMQVVRI